ncbi:hypothetical protein NMG93_01815 [Metamycoplasma hyosynoviae]|uniref:Uncharacterized protein n=1 Tax=Metamycoplasma hyosynoviae TaxID=29559 RepID=A0A9Q9F323_9BACT|nr:hypothetical protein [Metamycoplasma hyosynoviae]UTO25600.1 hypothetical protein NMG93_01815 [Metamycoplasma hyosynoviae]
MVNSDTFGYYLYQHNGHQVACLNSRKALNFRIPNKIDSFKVKKATNLYVNETFLEIIVFQQKKALKNLKI